MADQSLSGQRQFGKYIVQRKLGSGANSVIYEVLDSSSGQTYALKRIVRRTFDDDRFFHQAENEYLVGPRINHPSIRKIHSLNRVRSFFRVKEVHLLMEMFYGQTLEAHRPSGMLTSVRIFRQAVDGLNAMHLAGFAHADIKPNNILVGPDGGIKIIDLGQSCPLGAVKERIQGTPDYIAPEQVHRRPIDQRTDVFNIGATMYWVLTGQHVPTVLPRSQPGRDVAFAGATTAAPPDQLNPRVTPALSRLILDCVNVDPAARPADMRVLNSRLEVIEVILSKSRAQRSAGRPGDNGDHARLMMPEDDTIDEPSPELDEAV